MRQIVYISTAREPISDATCQQILAVSRRNNNAAGVTGLLVAGDKRFLQALEGPEAAVAATYARIAADPRHMACVVLSDRQVETRAFGDWAMGHASGRDSRAAASPTEIVESLVESLDDANLRAQFLGFAKLQAAA